MAPLYRTGWRMMTAGALGAAALGVVLPLVPTTPFLLVAAWSATRHSPELERRLLAHPRFGPHLSAWRAERALTRRTKWLAVAALVVSLALVVLAVESLALRLGVAVLLSGIAAYLWTRPEPGRSNGERMGSCV